MIKVTQLESQIMEVAIHTDLTHDTWLNYQNVILNLLNQSKKKVYILSDFTRVTSFNSQFSELECIDYLAHPRLGLNVLLCSCPVMSFQLKLSENRLQKLGIQLPVRLHKDYASALDVLKQSHDEEHLNPENRTRFASLVR